MRIFALLLAACAAANTAGAEDRAVVIGNADYATAPDLAGSDTTALAGALADAGFTTASGIDQALDDMLGTLDLLARGDGRPGARIVALSGRFVHGAGDTWFLGTAADKPGPLTAGSQGVALSLIVQLMAGGDPGSVLMLGTDEQDMPHQPGLTSGTGPMAQVAGVSVVTGSPEAVARAIRELAAGRSVEQALAAGQGLALLPGGQADLVPVTPGGPRAAPGPDPGRPERVAWAQAAQLDKVAGYDTYLSRFPQGLFSVAAAQRRGHLRARHDAEEADRAAWAGAALANAAAPYQDYLRRFPQGHHADVARKRLADLRIQATPRHAPQAAEAAMSLTQDARIAIQRGLARLGYDMGEFDGILGNRSRRAIQAWQRSHGHGESGYLNPAQHKALQEEVAYLDGDNGGRDRAYWLQTGARGDAQQLRAYLARYPEGRYSAEARRELNRPAGAALPPAPGPRGDAATWRWARQQDSAAAYDSYLERFPRGMHHAEARERRDSLRAGTEAARREEAVLGLDLATRRLIEERLRASGSRPGPVDGEFTDDTRAALRRYQSSHNLRVTGYVSPQTVASLLAQAARPR